MNIGAIDGRMVEIHIFCVQARHFPLSLVETQVAKKLLTVRVVPIERQWRSKRSGRLEPKSYATNLSFCRRPLSRLQYSCLHPKHWTVCNVCTRKNFNSRSRTILLTVSSHILVYTLTLYLSCSIYIYGVLCTEYLYRIELTSYRYFMEEWTRRNVWKLGCTSKRKSLRVHD
jgi:hypothetical protein